MNISFNLPILVLLVTQNHIMITQIIQKKKKDNDENRTFKGASSHFPETINIPKTTRNNLTTS